MGEISPAYLSESDFDEYCDLLIDGMTTRQASEKLNKSRQNIAKWLNRYATDDQRDQYARALEFSADFLIDDAKEIADDSSGDEKIVRGERVLNREFAHRSQIRVDIRKFMASKRNSKRYGDKISQELTGKDGGAIEIKNAVSIYIPDNQRDPAPQIAEPQDSESAPDEPTAEKPEQPKE